MKIKTRSETELYSVLAWFCESYIDKYKKFPTVDELAESVGVDAIRAENYLRNISDDYQIEDDTTKFEDAIIQELRKIADKELIIHDRDIIKPFEIDIFVPELSLGIEVNGSFTHSEYRKYPKYHMIKSKICREAGIRLIHIFGHNWSYRSKNSTLELLADALGSLKICENSIDFFDTKEIDELMAAEFCSMHYCGVYKRAKINIGLFYAGNLVGILSADGSRNNRYKIVQFVVNPSFKREDTMKKLIDSFIDMYKPEYISFYLDWSKYSIDEYKALGFQFRGIYNLSYIWYQRKSKIITCEDEANLAYRIGQVSDTLDAENALRFLGYYKVYDAGYAKLTLRV